MPRLEDPVRSWVAFVQQMRRHGLPVDAGRTITAVNAIAALGAQELWSVYWAGRASCCGTVEQLRRYDELFAAWVQGDLEADDGVLLAEAAPVDDAGPAPGRPTAADTGDVTPSRAGDGLDALGRADLAELDDDDLLRVQALVGAQRWLATNPVRRRRPGSSGRVDVERTVSDMVGKAGEITRIHHDRRRRKHRRVVVMLDVSRSMSDYVDTLLHVAYAAVQTAPFRVEAFTMGTRLTRVTRELRGRSPAPALAAARAAVPDWNGGTRLGESLETFVGGWGRRGTARGAVVVVLSDACVSGPDDAAQLALATQALRRLSSEIVWANPNLGHRGYDPHSAGLRAVAPHVTAVVPAGSYRALTDLAAHLARDHHRAPRRGTITRVR